MKTKPVPATGGRTDDDGGYRPMDSNVSGGGDVYGEPKGPVPDTGTRARANDRQTGNFVGGTDVVSRGDQVGSGPTGHESEGPKTDDGVPLPFETVAKPD